MHPIVHLFLLGDVFGLVSDGVLQPAVDLIHRSSLKVLTENSIVIEVQVNVDLIQVLFLDAALKKLELLSV